MKQIEPAQEREAELRTEIERLRREVDRLQSENRDLQISLLNTAEHGDLIEAELHASNQKLQTEISERRLAQATLQSILETVSRDKADLELILKATAEHGDVLEYQLYTQAVETMRQSEEMFRAISESTSILMILTQELDGAIAYANSVSSEQLGLSQAELVGHKLEEFFVNSEDVEYLITQLSTQGHVRNHEMQIKRWDGQLMWVSASVQPLNLSRKPTLLTTLYDISDRKQAEAALRQSQEELQQQAQDLERRVEQRTLELRQAEEKYRSIFENAAEGIFQTTLEGRYLNANPALAEIYGYDSPEEMIAKITDIGQQLYVQPRRRDEILAYLKRFNSVTGFESEIYCRDGTIIWISENMRAVKDSEGRILYFEGSVRNITDRKSAEEEIRRQRMMSERLLLNVLPQPIAERLKRGEKTIADSFAEATVLFADIANFTELSSHISPAELVNLLNDIFSAFDNLADQHEVEKIKTIGDAYMVVGGVPNPRPDHVAKIADMALDMIEAVRQFKTSNNQLVTLRIGIHTGPVVAGVIGARKFIYDLWGDTVNIASRMESQGEAGQIQVTDAVHERLKKRYRFQERGNLDVKGKGLMSTHWLLERKIQMP